MSEFTKPYEEKMDGALRHLDKELVAIRAGRANPAILDRVTVDYYGSPTPINQMAAVAVAEARILTITPWDASLIHAIEHALLVSDIGINPTDDGRVIRLVFPAPTEERRRQQMRSEFFQNASHELKTPITSIGGFAQLLQSGMVTEEETRQRYLHNIEKETGRMAELIGDILKISRYEEGEVPRNELVDLEAVAGEVMERLQPVADRQGISLEMASRGDDLRLWGSKKDMEDLIGNLCDNAVKYNRPGGSVRVLLTALPEEVQIAVEDTGVGIPAAHLSRVFERFYRVEKDRNKKVGGTGLGLAIVKHICALYGGRVDIQSAEGRGTTVTAVLRRER